MTAREANTPKINSFLKVNLSHKYLMLNMRTPLVEH